MRIAVLHVGPADPVLDCPTDRALSRFSVRLVLLRLTDSEIEVRDLREFAQVRELGEEIIVGNDTIPSTTVVHGVRHNGYLLSLRSPTA